MSFQGVIDRNANDRFLIKHLVHGTSYQTHFFAYSLISLRNKDNTRNQRKDHSPLGSLDLGNCRMLLRFISGF